MAMPRNIRVIPPNRNIGTQKRTAAVQKTRVAAYCRVSTESEEQETSYEMQVLHYTALIKTIPAGASQAYMRTTEYPVPTH
jgi:hypothetical protein